MLARVSLLPCFVSVSFCRRVQPTPWWEHWNTSRQSKLQSLRSHDVTPQSSSKGLASFLLSSPLSPHLQSNGYRRSNAWVAHQGLTREERRSGSLAMDAQSTVESSARIQRVEDLVSALGSNVLQALRSTPDWDIFSENFQVVDRTGNRSAVLLENLEAAKLFMRLLRRARDNFDVKEEIEIQSESEGSLILSKCKVHLGGAEVPILGRDVIVQTGGLLGKEPLEIETTLSWQVDDDLRIESLMIDTWVVNGVPLQLLPDIKLADNPATNLFKFQEWTRDIMKLQKLNVDRQEARTRRPVANDFKALSTALGQDGSVETRAAWNVVGLTAAMDGLQNDIPDIFIKEPNWELFVHDFELIDQSGVKVKRLDPNKVVLRLLREFHTTLNNLNSPLKDEFKVQTEKTFNSSFEDILAGNLDPILVARWTYEIDTRGSGATTLDPIRSALFSSLGIPSAMPLKIAGTSTFRFNTDGKVVSMIVDSYSVNGNELNFPDVEEWVKRLRYGPMGF